MTAFWRLLDGAENAEVPIEWWLSRMCEEFHCLPSEAMREYERAPVGLLESILEYRAFSTAKGIVERSKQEDIPDTPMCHLAQEIHFGLAQEEIDRKKAEAGIS